MSISTIGDSRRSLSTPILGVSAVALAALSLLPLACTSGPSSHPPVPPSHAPGERLPASPTVPEEVARARAAEESLELASGSALPAGTLDELAASRGARSPETDIDDGAPYSRSPTPADGIVSRRIADHDAADLVIELVIEGMRFAPRSARPARPAGVALGQLAARLRLGDRDFLIEIQAAASAEPAATALAARRGRAVAAVLSREAGLARDRLSVVVLQARATESPRPERSAIAILVLRPASSP